MIEPLQRVLQADRPLTLSGVPTGFLPWLAADLARAAHGTAKGGRAVVIAADEAAMRALADQLRDKMKSGVVALGAATDDGKVSLLVVVTKDLTAKIKAGDVIKPMAAEVGGTGGGRPEMAQAGGKDPSKLDASLEKVFGLVEQALQR